MYEKLIDLAEKSRITFDCDPCTYGHEVYFDTQEEFNRFIESVIRECANICYDHSRAAGGVETAFGFGYKECGDDIKKHFGIEESKVGKS